MNNTWDVAIRRSELSTAGILVSGFSGKGSEKEGRFLLLRRLGVCPRSRGS